MQWVGNHIEEVGRSRLTCYYVNTAREEAPNDHPDHLGSSSFITDAIGYATQHLQYLPFGETFVDQTPATNPYDSRYTFSAKEKDDETGYSYFGARYYDSDLSVWLSVDPLSDERSWISPYNYCQNNPIGRIDPTGALDDGFVVDLQGEITRVDDTGGDDFDVLYNKADYEAGKRDYDETGTKSGIQIDNGEVSNFQSIPIKNLDGVQTGSLSACEVKTKDVADKIFKFLADNTTVEWQNSNFTSPDGKSVNVIATSREGGKNGGTITGGRELDESYMRKGYTLNIHNHSHPYNYYLGWKVSGYYGNTPGFGKGDLGVKQILQNFETKSGARPGANAKFSMYWRGNFYPY